MAFNGSWPGPALEYAPGDVISIEYENNLPADKAWPGYVGSCWRGPNGGSLSMTHRLRQLQSSSIPLAVGYLNNPHAFHETNLHLHGLQVTPHVMGDDVLIHVMPGQTEQMCVPIPSDHPSGLFWFHPHRHGSTTVQINNGLAGTLIVRGDIDKFLGRFQEAVLVGQLMQYNWNATSRVYENDPLPFVCPDNGGFEAFQFELNIMKVSGVTVGTALQPRSPSYSGIPAFNLTGKAVGREARPGEILWVRLLNTASELVSSLAIQCNNASVQANTEVFVAAVDGMTLSAPVPIIGNLTRGILFAPDAPGLSAPGVQFTSGQRLDLLIRVPYDAPAGTVVQLVSRKWVDCSPGSFCFSWPYFPWLDITVKGSALAPSHPQASLPPALPVSTRNPPILQSSIVRTRTWRFSMGGSQFPNDNASIIQTFGFNDLPYNSSRIDATLVVGTTEEWIIENPGPVAHPFHIHVNPFFVVGLEDLKTGKNYLTVPYWADIVHVPAGTRARLYMKINEFTGDLVAHCHFLSHEDMGLMINVRFAAPTDLTTATVKTLTVTRVKNTA